MNKKILSIICLLLLNVVIAVPHAYAARKVLSVPVYSQIDDFSCWAACCKSIIQFCEGSSPSQQTIINYIPGGDNGASLDESKQALAHWNVISSKKSSALTYSGVGSQIDNNHPIWAGLSRGGGWAGQHANVIRGYDTSTNFVLYLDPTGGDYHGQTYSTYVNGMHWDDSWWTWDSTIYDCT